MKYQIVIDYEAPPIGDYNFSNTIAQEIVEKALGEYLNRCDDYRRASMSKLYSIQSANTVITR